MYAVCVCVNNTKSNDNGKKLTKVNDLRMI